MNMKTIPASKVQKLTRVSGFSAYIDCVIPHGSHGLVIVGWLYDPQARIRQFGLLADNRRGQFGRKTCDYVALGQDDEHVCIHRVARPDVGAAMGDPDSDEARKHGFVIVAANMPQAQQLALETTDGAVFTLRMERLGSLADINLALAASREHSGRAISEGMRQVFGVELPVPAGLEGVTGADDGDVTAPAFSAIDHVLRVADSCFVINGWIALKDNEIAQVVLEDGKRRTDVTHQLQRYVRRDLNAAFPWSAGAEALGFLCLLADVRDKRISLVITGRDGRTQTCCCQVDRIGMNDLVQLASDHDVDFALALQQLLGENRATSGDEACRLLPAALRRGNVTLRSGRLPGGIENPDVLYASVDRSYPLGSAGLLVYGWFWSVAPQLVRLKVYDEEGVSWPVQAIRILRRDVVEAYQDQLAGLTGLCGFVFLAPLPTRPGDQRVLGIDMGSYGETWLNLPTPAVRKGLALAREMVALIPEPMTQAHQLYELFDTALGPAIQAATGDPLPSPDCTVRRFGMPPAQARWSVIVPLYGRADFLRFQLAQFANDPDFADCDLLYVVDDPGLVTEVLELAARYESLFGVAFRVIWYERNLGFAGANNIGVDHATADIVVLMNSDVLPQQPGWLSTLAAELLAQPAVGAVGPLLEFADGSIQHAGMRPQQTSGLPGFLLNTHPGMGVHWEGGEQPRAQIMLTAACLMMARADYLAVGGLDEGYLVGDFEDSDLCMALRKRDLACRLVPAARLWHLERQSMTRSGSAEARQLLTLYNGWRYRQKISSGEIADPVGVEVTE